MIRAGRWHCPAGMRDTRWVTKDVRGECLVARGYMQALRCTMDHFDALGVAPERTESLRRQLHDVAEQLEQIVDDLINVSEPVLSA